MILGNQFELLIVLSSFIVAGFLGLNFSLQTLIRLYIFISIFSGFIRRVATWLGIPLIGSMSLYILPLVSILILIKMFKNNSKLDIKGLSFTWVGIIFFLVFGSFYPFSQGASGSIITFGAYLPLITFFLLGRRAKTELDLKRILKDLAIFSVANAVYCIYQFIIGFPIWDRKWVESQISYGYTSLSVDGVIRPFGFLTSAAECASLLALGFFCCVGLAETFKRNIYLQFLAFLSLFALVATGVRTSILLTFIAIMITGSKLFNPRKILLFVFLTTGLIFSISSLFPNGVYLSRIVLAFTDPLSLETIQIRSQNTRRVLENLESNPFGFGLSSLVNGAAKYGNQISRGTDVIFADAIAALGYVGLIIAVFIVGTCLVNSVKLKKSMELWVIVIPLIHFNYLINPNHYAITPLAWFCLGIASSQQISKIGQTIIDLQRK